MPSVITAITAFIGTAIASAGVGAYTSALIATTITTGAIIAGTSKILSGAFAPDMPGDFNSRSGSMLINKRANNAPIPIVYGERLVGGTIVWLDSHGDMLGYGHSKTGTGFLSTFLVVSEGEIESYEHIYINGESEFKIRTTGGLKYDDDLWIAERYGTEAQIGFSSSDTFRPVNRPQKTTLEGVVPYYDRNKHRLAGTAYLWVQAWFNPTIYPSGLPTITALVKGVKLFDPRSSLTEWSNNPALCIRDYLTNARYGRSIEGSLIDDATFIIAANYCDEIIDIFGVNKKRYSCDGVALTDNTSMQILNEMLTSCKGFLVFSGGKYKLILDKPEAPTFAFSEEHIIGNWDIVLGNKSTMFNRIRANFSNKNKGYQPDIAIVDSPELRLQDEGILLEKTIDLLFTSDVARAKMIATINLNESRQAITCEFTSTIEGMLAEVGDVVYINHDTPAWVNKKFRIMKIVLINTDEVRIQAVEYSDNVYDFLHVDLLTENPTIDMDDISFCAPPTNFNYEIIEIDSVLTLSWTKSVDSFVANYEIHGKPYIDDDWSYYDTVPSTIFSLTKEIFVEAAQGDLDFIPSINYSYFRIRAVNINGVTSEWVE